MPLIYSILKPPSSNLHLPASKKRKDRLSSILPLLSLAHQGCFPPDWKALPLPGHYHNVDTSKGYKDFARKNFSTAG
jgi:hypothetical protein